MQPADHPLQQHPHYDPNPRHHPGLRVIALIEGVKGVLALIAASGLAVIGPVPLKRWVHALIDEFQLDPDHGAMAWLSHTISPGSVHVAAAGVAAYGVLHVLEAWGLWRDRAWASWLGCLGAALYLPFDVYALVKHPGWVASIAVIVNVVVVAVLARDLLRRRY